MRMVFYLFVVTACAALPIESVPLTHMAAEKTDDSPSDRRVPRAARFPGLDETTVTAANVEALADMLGESLPLTLAGTGKPDLMLHDGRILKAARIVALDEAVVMIAHEEGLTNVEIELVPLDALERARATIAAVEAEKKKVEAEAVARAAERIRESDAKSAAQRQERLAMPNARADLPAGELAVNATRQPTDPAPRLFALKDRFPPRRKGRNALGIEFDLPPRQIWSFYHSNFEETTLATLPETLAILEARLTQDIATWEWRSNSTQSMAQSVEHLQAERTLTWLSQTLADFLHEARLLMRER